jgi:hypothetical protein
MFSGGRNLSQNDFLVRNAQVIQSVAIVTPLQGLFRLYDNFPYVKLSTTSCEMGPIPFLTPPPTHLYSIAIEQMRVSGLLAPIRIRS